MATCRWSPTWSRADARRCCSTARLAEIGYALAIYPVAGLLSAAAALNTVYRQIRDTGSSLGSPAPLYPFAEMNRLMGFEDVWAFDKAHTEI